jgi:uncharacterized protein
MRIVLDTNVLLVSASRRSALYSIFEAFIEGQYELCVTTDILLEYQEVLTRHVGIDFADEILRTITSASNTVMVTNYFQWDLIKEDPDDNKFVDCAISCGADFITTDDRHFQVLRFVPFPKVEVLSSSAFLIVLKDYNA